MTNLTGFGEVYTLPCNVELNVTFKFANVSYPIHPLDTSLQVGQVDSVGNPICVGAFQPIPSSAVSSTFDMILGMAFCESPLVRIMSSRGLTQRVFALLQCATRTC